jgi:cyanate permease
MMKQKFGKSFILIPIGLFFLAGTLLFTQFENTSDMVKGLLFGIGIGLILLPFIVKKIKPSV